MTEAVVLREDRTRDPASDAGSSGGAGRASEWGRLWQQGEDVATALGAGARSTVLGTLGATDMLARQGGRPVVPALWRVCSQFSRRTCALMRTIPGGAPS